MQHPSLRRQAARFASVIGYIATIFVANYLITEYGFVNATWPFDLGLVAPAGVFAAGLAFTFRDFTHEAWGRAGVVAAIFAGALLSSIISPEFALASGVAFLFSELADLLVYSPLRNRNWFAAVLASNTVGAVLDSALFLFLAFGSLAFIEGQIVGKIYITLVTIIPIFVGYRIWKWRAE